MWMKAFCFELRFGNELISVRHAPMQVSTETCTR
jgi:hypothetical protein